MLGNTDKHSAITKLLIIVSLVFGVIIAGTWLGFSPGRPTSGAMAAPMPFQSVIGNPNLTLEKTVDNDAPAPGQVIEYTLSYANTEPGSEAFNVRLYDFLPAGVTYLSASPTPATNVDGVLMFTAPSISPGPATDVSVRVRVLPGYDQLYNHALLTAEGVTPTQASLLTAISPSAYELTITKDGDGLALTGGEVIYEISCENTGLVQLDDIVVMDILPAGMVLTDTSPTATVNANLLQWSVGTLAPGGDWSAVVTATAPTHVGSYDNVALADNPKTAVTQTLFTTQVISEGAILRLSKSASAERVYAHDELVYTLHYENKGNQSATDAVLTDTLPSGIQVTGTQPDADSLTTERGVWTLAPVTPGEEGTIVITATVTITPTTELIIENQAEVVWAGGLWSDEASVETTIVPNTIYLPILLRNFSA